jgi:hypothetical protein
MCIDQEMKVKIFPLKQQGLHAHTFHQIDDSEEHKKMNHLVDLSNQIVMKKKPPSGTNESIKLDLGF